jgi:hypothetical protein
VYYVAHRLFALHDRALGALVAHELAAHVGADAVFLPFCDTDEEELVADRKGHRLFELDVERLWQLSGLVAILHGPSLDDGVCMEIGFACRRGVPVVLMTTDFQTYGLHPDGAELQFPDPLLEAVATDVVRVSHMAKLSSPGGDRFEAFGNRNTAPLRPVARQAVDRLLAATTVPGDATTPAQSSTKQAFVEASPYGGDNRTHGIGQQLIDRGFSLYEASRLQAVGGYEEILHRARTDWRQLQRSEVLVVDIGGPETPPGAALLIGASVADNRPILADYADRSYTFAHGREPNYRNLMIQYSLTGRFRTLDGLRRLLDDA